MSNWCVGTWMQSRWDGSSVPSPERGSQDWTGKDGGGGIPKWEELPNPKTRGQEGVEQGSKGMASLTYPQAQRPGAH